MPKQKLFDDDSEEEVIIKTENAYAKKYDTWREKEEIHKLEQKYGSKALNSDASVSSDSEDESDEPPEVSEEVEEQFLKTLSLLKTKDPRIYDPSYKFFEEKQKKELKEEKKKTLTFADSDDDDDDDDGGNIFSIEKKAEIVEDKEAPGKDKGETSKPGKEGKLQAFLTGKVEHINDPVEKDLAPLKALWSDPALNEGEAFLRDYILNKRYLDPESESCAAEDRLRDDAALEEDARTVEEQGQFERAYNFRFEEPDHEYLKRFPRTMSSVRPKDERRARRRADVRTRKQLDKQRKMEEIARLKALKLKEIQEKIAKIKEVTGNEQLAFNEEDIEGEFDPEQHDRRMRAIFDDHYYGEPDHEKPVFPDLDHELEIENWDEYEPGASHGDAADDDDDDDGDGDDENGPHCEDAEFNMDAEYDPKRARVNLLQEIQSTLGKKRRNRKKKSKLAKLLAKEKPKYIPTEVDKTYDEYMEEYYKMDCEDVIAGELPTRFKYREVVPNDYGLSVEEILLADDKELTQWVPLKKLVRHKAESAQKSEVHAYRQKAADVALKRKLLPSLFKHLPEEPELVVPKEAAKEQKKKKKNKEANDTAGASEENDVAINENSEQISETPNDAKKKKKKESREVGELEIAQEDEPSANESSEQNSKTVADSKKKNKKKNKSLAVENETVIDVKTSLNVENNVTEDTAKRKKKKKSKQAEEISCNIESKNTSIENNEHNNTEKQNGISENKKKKKKSGFEVENVLNITPSQESVTHKNLKRKFDGAETSQVPNKKKKNKNNANTQNMQGKKKKDFKNFKKDFKTKKVVDKTPDNPLSKLSDERLKAYGLNPKKYKNFLKYKKF